MEQNRHYFSPYYPYIEKPNPDSWKDTPSQRPHDFETKLEQSPQWETINIAEQINTMQKKLAHIEAQYTKLKEQMAALKPVTVENVNYKIQDLHVKELSGTLHVGLTALSDAEQLENMLAEDDAIQLNDADLDTEQFADEWADEEENKD